MRLLFLAKREPQQRDLVQRPYGRFHHLPVELARLGHEVRVLLVSHHGTPPARIERDGVEVIALDPRRSGPRGTLDDLVAHAREWKPDWVVGCSDAWYGWLACNLASKLGTRLLIDAYDNYEAYMPWNFILHWQWRKSCRLADAVTAAGPQLAQLLARQRRGSTIPSIVPMAADPHFLRQDPRDSREKLGLPQDVALIGYAGSWAGNRGTDVLLDAFRRVRHSLPQARLVLTGRPPAHALAQPGVIGLGYVDDALLPAALSALDVACIVTAETAFGRYSYPAKLCEALACGVSVVATSTEPVRWMLRDDARFLVPVGDARALAERLVAQVDEIAPAYPPQPTWRSSALAFQEAILTS